ncbi:MAG: FAD-dependent oxidoreductase [Coriobacteriales bacterium]|jgi:hypothetical protein|nr:FAD-dependent oxidoreductase [Coriobacteriales bacterium]
MEAEKKTVEEQSGLSRRGFLTGAATAGAGALATFALSGCSPAEGQTPEPEATGDGENAGTGAQAWDYRPVSLADQVSETRDYEIVVVGGGNAGVFGALHLAELGAKVVVLEQSSGNTMWAGDIDALDSQIQKDLGIVIDKEFVVKDIVERYAQGRSDENLVRQWAYNAGAMVDWFQAQIQKKGLEVMVDTECKKFYPENFFYSPASVHTAYKPPLLPTANSMGSEVAMPAMLELFAEYGGEMIYDTKAVELVQPDGPGTQVTGVLAQDVDGGVIQFNASKCVMLATGGFSGNKDMMDQWGVNSHKFCSNHLGGEGRNGDGIKMATWAGADRDWFSANGSCNIFDRGAITGDSTNGNVGDAPDRQGGGNMNFWWPGSQPFLRVNAFGQRFCNEDGPYDVAFNLACMQPGHFWWQVFDSSSWDDVVAFDTTICSRVVAREGAKNCLLLGQFYPCTSAEEWQEVYIDPNVANGVLIKADTLEELADLMEFDANVKATFLATVTRYNELTASGVDSDHDKAPWRMSALDAPPYYACKLTGWLLSTLSGIRVDNRYNALTAEGTPIPGLKMVGLDHGGFFSGMYAQYYGGLNLSHNLIAAWLGAKDIMGAKPPVPLESVAKAYLPTA